GGGADASETGEMDVEGQEGLAQESGEGEGDEGRPPTRRAASRRSRNTSTSKTTKTSDSTLMEWMTSASRAHGNGNGRNPSRKTSVELNFVAVYVSIALVVCIVF
ncbi:hypothetical protein BCR44DRAFT_41097, partial [Catenaria anguillulae PL171]